MTNSHALYKALLDRIAAGTASDDDQARFQKAVQAGQVQLVTGDRAVALGGDATDAVIVTGNGNTLQIVHGTDVGMIQRAFETARAASPESEYERLTREWEDLRNARNKKDEQLNQLRKQYADMINNTSTMGESYIRSQIRDVEKSIYALNTLINEKDKRLSELAQTRGSGHDYTQAQPTPPPPSLPEIAPKQPPGWWLWLTRIRIHWRFIFEWIVATTVSFPLAWIVAVQVGDPLGGIMFDVVDFIMSFFTEDKPPNLVGSAGKYATFGVVVGSAQWYMLNRYRNGTTWWILAMVLGLALGGIVFEATEETFLGGAILGGAVFGIVQWIWLQHNSPTKAAWWIVVTTVSSAVLHYMLTSVFPEKNSLDFVWLGAIWGATSAMFFHWLLPLPRK